jgi:hypothetical protein
VTDGWWAMVNVATVAVSLAGMGLVHLYNRRESAKLRAELRANNERELAKLRARRNPRGTSS